MRRQQTSALMLPLNPPRHAFAFHATPPMSRPRPLSTVHYFHSSSTIPIAAASDGARQTAMSPLMLLAFRRSLLVDAFVRQQRTTTIH
jgi:hypothetical protein